MERQTNMETKLVLPGIDPRLRSNLNVLYVQMKEKQQNKFNKDPKDSNFRRCNRCGQYYLIEFTVLRKYYAHSKRKYRLCKICEKKYS